MGITQIFKRICILAGFLSPSFVSFGQNDTIPSPGCNVSVTIFRSACEEYLWDVDSNTYTSDTTLYTVIPLSPGCDSSITLHLTINQNTSVDTFAVVCDSMEWSYFGFLHVSQNASIITTNSKGCDSTVTLHLTVNHATFCDTVVFACDSFSWYGSTWFLNDPPQTPPSRTITNATGCDSTVTLQLTINTSYTADTTAVVCDSFTWYGESWTFAAPPATPPTHTFSSASNCDSIVTLHLTINHSDITDTVAEVCGGLVWHGLDLSQSGTYTWPQNLPSLNSVGCDSLSYLHLTTYNCSTRDTFAVDSITIDGTTYTESCTVIIDHDTLVLTICHTFRDITDTTVCDLFSWNGLTLTHDTIISDTLQKADLCDSIIGLQLIVYNSSTGDTSAYACENYSWWNTNYTNSTNTATHTYTNHLGCDSVVTLNLTIYHATSGDTTAVACDSFIWHGTPYTTSGSYNSPLSFSNSHGCDSTVTLHLTVNASSSGDTTAYSCDGFTWYGETWLYDNPPAIPPTHTLTNAKGCDSTVTLHLTINTVSFGDTNAVVCDSILWYGTLFTNEGDYQHLLSSRLPSHCDSLLTLHLTVNRSVISDISDSFCTGTTYHFAGEDITAGGLYYEHLSSYQGCDSTVRLFLTMLTPPVIRIDHDYDCLSLTHLLHANANVDFINWSSSDGWPDEWGSPHGHTLALNVNHNVTLTLLADYYDYPTCPNSKSITLQPIIKPEALMQVTPEFLTNESLTLSASSHSRNALWLQWFINGSEYSYNEHISYTADDKTDSVTVTLLAYSNLCTDTTEKTIYVRRSSIFAPNAFTPDESTNRTFGILCNGVVEYELSIYNRQGLLLFQSTSDGLQWDGTKNGIPCPQGTYVWIVRYRTIIDPKNWHTEKGSITLLR